MIVEREDNSALYFIVGALLVAVAGFAIYFFASNRTAPVPEIAEGIRAENSVNPSAGGGAPSATTGAESTGSSMSLSVDNNGTTATTTTTQQ